MNPNSKHMGPLAIEGKEVVFNVFKYFRDRKRDKTTEEFEQDINLAKVVATATGVSDKTVKRVVKEGLSDGGDWDHPKFRPPNKAGCPRKRVEISKATLDSIRQKIEQYRTDGEELPAMREFNEILRESNIIYCSHTHLRKIISDLGYNFHKRKLRHQDDSIDSDDDSSSS